MVDTHVQRPSSSTVSRHDTGNLVRGLSQWVLFSHARFCTHQDVSETEHVAQIPQLMNYLHLENSVGMIGCACLQLACKHDRIKHYCGGLGRAGTCRVG